MVDLATYRARIGSYNARAGRLPCQGGANMDRSTGLLTSLLAASLLGLLLVIGGVESNPGPNTTPAPRWHLINGRWEKIDAVANSIKDANAVKTKPSQGSEMAPSGNALKYKSNKDQELEMHINMSSTSIHASKNVAAGFGTDSQPVLLYKKAPGASTAKGLEFEWTMAALLYLRLLKTGLKFYLATNVEGAGQLDDIVVRFEEVSGQWKTLFVQLKHKETEKLSWSMLTTTSKKNGSKFSLPNYFKSYLKIKQAMTEGKRELMFEGTLENCQIVIFTNSKAGGKLEKKPVTVSKYFSQAEKLLWSGSGSVFSFETDQEMLECLAECGDEGREFLKQLRVFCGQPSLDEMTKAVREEVVKLYPDINIERIFECFLHNVKVWWETCNEILHENHSILQTAINKVRLQTCSEQTVKEYVLPLEFESTALLKFGEGLAYIESSESTCRLTLTKLVSTSLSSEVQCLVLTLEQLSTNKTALLAECSNKDKDKKCSIIIIVNTKDQRSVQLDVIIEMLQCLRDTFSIVILSDGNNSIGSEVSERFLGGCKSYKDHFKMSQIKPGSKDALLNKKLILQGHEVFLGTLLDNGFECLDQVLPASLVVEILETDGPLAVGSALPEGIGYYIERTLEQPCVKPSVFQALRGSVTVRVTQIEESDSDLFDKAIDFLNSLKYSHLFHSGYKKDIVNQLLQSPLVPVREDSDISLGAKFPLGFYEFDCLGFELGQENEVIALRVCPREEAPQQVSFLFVTNQTNASNVAILSEFHQSQHLVSLTDGHLRWCSSHEDFELIRKHMDKNQVSRFAPKTAMEVEDRLVLVCAEPGMGKSTLMARLAKNTKAALPNYFVILIALNDHTKLFAEDKHDDALGFLSIAAKMDSPLQRSLLKFALEVSGNVVVIADGFDEIAPKFIEQSYQLLSSLLEKTKTNRIWLTSRNSVKHILVRYFSKFSAKISEFDKDEQKHFLQKFWAGKLSPRKLNEFIDHLLEKSGKAIGDKERNFLGIPLQTQMLAEVYEDHVTDSAEKIAFPDKLDLLSLVEKFMKKKFSNYIQEKLKIAYHDSNEETLLTMSVYDFFASHTNAALILILGDDDMKSLGLGRIFTDSFTFFNDIKRGAYKTGFIDEIVNGKPRFIHRVFAEYLVANWISEHSAGHIEFVQSKMFTPDFTVIRYFFNGILCKGYDLHTAVLQENVEQVKTLLEREDIDVEAQDAGGRTALHLAASLGASEDQNENKRHCEILNLIIGKTRHFQVVDNVLRGSPLRYADITRWLIAIDKLLCKTDDNGQLILTVEDVRDEDMLDTILQQDLDKLLEFCLDNGLAVEHQHKGKYGGWVWTRLLVYACRNGSVKVASLLIERNANINKICSSNENQDTIGGPLMAASYEGHLEVVELLVEKYVSTFSSPLDGEVLDGETKYPDVSQYINVIDESGRTAIHLAAMKGHTDVITYLLSQGGDPLRRDRYNQTPLDSWAEECKGSNTLRVLLEAMSEADRFAAISSLDKNGDSLFHRVAIKGAVKSLKLLFEAGGKIYQKNRDRETPLMIAAWRGYQEAVQWFLNNFNEEREGISLVDFINIKNKDGKTAIHEAARRGHADVLAYLLSHGGDPLSRDEDYGTLLHFATRNNDPNTLRVLLEAMSEADRVAGISSLDHQGNSVVYYAKFEDRECLKILLEAGGKMSQKTRSGETMLMSATDYSGIEEFLKWSLDNFNPEREGITLADFINLKDENYGWTVIHWAASEGHTEVITYLLSQGGDPLSRDRYNRTPLHLWADRNYDPNALRLLLEALSEAERVAAINSFDDRGRSVLHHAVSNGSVECLQVLVDAGGKLYHEGCDGKTLLITATNYNVSHETVKWLLGNFNEEKEDVTLADFINMKDEDGRTAMQHVAWSVQCPLKSLKPLYEAGGKLNQVDHNGITTLMAAAMEGEHEVVKWLMDNFNEEREGIKLVDLINMKDKDGNSAIYHAGSARNGSVECLKHLYDAGGKL